MIAYNGRPVYAAIVSAVLVFPDPGGPVNITISYIRSYFFDRDPKLSERC